MKIPIILATIITALGVFGAAAMTLAYVNHEHHWWGFLVYYGWQIALIGMAWLWVYAHSSWRRAAKDREFWFGRAEHWRKQWEHDYDQEIKGYGLEEGRHRADPTTEEGTGEVLHGVTDPVD